MGIANGAKSNRAAKPFTARFIGYLLLLGDIAGFLFSYALVSVILTDNHLMHLLTSKRVAALMILTIASLWLVDAFRLDTEERLWRSLARFLGGLSLAAGIFALGFFLGGPELLGGNYNFMGRSTLSVGALIFGCWGALLRVQTRAMQAKRAMEARWLLLGSYNDQGLLAFWRDFKTERGQGSLVLLTEPGFEPAPSPAGELPPVSGDWAELEGLLKEPWSGIIVASAIPEPVVRLLMQARLDGMRVKTIEEFCDRHWQRVPVEYLQGEWFAFANGFALLDSPLQAKLKRASDIVLATILFGIAGIPMVLVATLTKLFYRGPVLYTQPRMGRGGRTFTCFKFCTMHRVPSPGAGDCEHVFIGSETRAKCQESDTDGIYTSEGDSRITRLGRFLRKTRFDELPQLWNVLRGDMSFIGPRAEWTKCVDNYEDVIPFYHLRHLVRPGITGWAQVNYPYGASVEDARIKLTYDIWYIKNHNLFLDLLIVLRTVRVVLFRIGAR